VVINFGLLGLFKKKKLVFGEEVPVVIGTSKDGHCLGDGVIFDTGHWLATSGTNRRGCGNQVTFGKNRIDISGRFQSKKIGQERL